MRPNNSVPLSALTAPLAALVLSAALHAQTATEPSSAPPQTTLIWDSPSANSRGSMPIGNGDIGANVWVEPSGDLVLLLSKTDAWDENQRLVKIGRVRIKLDPAAGTQTGFQQELKLQDGLIRLRTPQAEIQVWIDANHPVVQVDGKSADGKPLSVTADLEVWRTEKKPCDPGYPNFVEPKPFSWPDTVMKSNGKEITWYHCNAVSPWRNNLKIQKLEAITETTRDPILGRTFGAVMRGDGMVAASDQQLKTAKPATTFSLRIHALTRPNSTPEKWHAALTQQVAAVEAHPSANRLAAHRQWWSDFWQRSWIHITGDKQAEGVTRAYDLQRWMSACSGRGAYPIKFNGSIFNVDMNEKAPQGSSGDPDYRRWGGCYWYQNTRLSYWPMLAAGDFDCMRPFFKLYTDNLPIRRLASKNYYNHAGAVFPETMTIWGTYNDVNYGPDRKNKPDGLTVNLYIRRYWQNGLEMIAMMLDYHDLTQDAKFRDHTLLPYATDILAFFDQHWPRGADGKILFDPAQSLETWHVATNPLPEIAGMRYIIPRLLKLTADTKLTKTWQKTLADLPPIPLTPSEPKRLLPAEKYSKKSNAENPELYAVFPFRLYTMAAGQDAVDIGNATYAKRGNKDNRCWWQNPIHSALLGQADHTAKSVYGRTRGVQPGFRFPAMWDKNNDWMPDQDHGGVMQSALQYMLLQYEGDQILLFPAWPKQWNVSFKLHAPKQTTIAGELRDGQVIKLTVTPESRRKDVKICQPQEPAAKPTH